MRDRGAGERAADARFQAGAAALEEDIPRVLRIMGASSLDDLGWSRPNKLSLLLPMVGHIKAMRTTIF